MQNTHQTQKNTQQIHEGKIENRQKWHTNPTQNARKYTRQLQKRTQQIHNKKKQWKHTNTIHKPCTKHVRKTHIRIAETHTTGSQKMIKH